MRKNVLVLIIFLTLCFELRTQEQRFETIVPGSPLLLLTTSEIRNFVKSLKFAVENLLSDQDRTKVMSEIDRINNRTGINILDGESLTKAGIDISRKAALAYYTESEPGKDRMAIFLPVTNDKTFPLNFIDIIKKGSGRQNTDLYPVVTSYRDRSIYQIQSDIFTTSLSGTFMIASTGELVHKAVDAFTGNGNSLAQDPCYIGYTQKKRENTDLDLYLSGEFFVTALKKFLQSPSGAQRQVQGMEDRGGFNSFLVALNGEYDPGNERDEKSPGKDGAFQSLNYAAAGITLDKEKLSIDLSADFNRSDSAVNAVLDTFKTGIITDALYLADANTFISCAFDPLVIDEFCRKDGFMCTYYKNFTATIFKELGLDCAADIFPSFNGVLSFFMGSDMYPTLNSSTALVIPLKSRAVLSSLKKKTASHLSKTGKRDEAYGETDIRGNAAYWYYNPGGKKKVVAFDRKALYWGGNPDYIGISMDAERLVKTSQTSLPVGRLDGETFLIGQIRKASLLKTLLLMQQGSAGRGMSFFSKTGDINFKGKKIDGSIFLFIDMEIFSDKK